MKRKYISIISKIIGIVLILSGIGLISYNLITDYISGKNSKEVLKELEVQLEGKIPPTDSDIIDVNKEMDIIDVNGNKYIGIISIPSVDIKLPVINEYSKQNIKIAPVLYKGSIYKNNAIIIAHNTQSHFRKIQNLNIGDKVTFIDVNGNEFNYEVIKKENISEKDTKIMEEGEWDLTLFTCTSSNIKFRTSIRLKLLK